MRLPLATVEDLLKEERMVLAKLEAMDAADIVDPTNWTNRRDSLLDHLDDVRAQLAEKAAT